MKNEEMFNSCAHEVEVESLAIGTPGPDINWCTSKVLFEKSLTPDPIKFLFSLIRSFMNHGMLIWNRLDSAKLSNHEFPAHSQNKQNEMFK